MDNREVLKWADKYYKEWLRDIQNQAYLPVTPIEKFFRYYTQGIHYVFNRALRAECDHEKFFRDSELISTDMFYGAIDEMKQHSAPENIVVYRYVEPQIFKLMCKWGKVKMLRKNSIIFDKAFLSTTITPETVSSQSYVTFRNKRLKIYVPKGTPCAFLEFIADMNENEVLFPPETKLKIIFSSLFHSYVECIVVN